jgi:hypothetical protein
MCLFGLIFIVLMAAGWPSEHAAPFSLNTVIIFAIGLELGQCQMKVEYEGVLTKRDIIDTFVDFLSWVFFPFIAMAALSSIG